MKIICRRYIYSDAPGAMGGFCMEAEREVLAIPRSGDFVELADGWASLRVKDVTFMSDGRVIVELDRTRAGDADDIREYLTLAADHDWSWVGPAPEL
jgi:hypothetical protein